MQDVTGLDIYNPYNGSKMIKVSPVSQKIHLDIYHCLRMSEHDRLISS